MRLCWASLALGGALGAGAVLAAGRAWRACRANDTMPGDRGLVKRSYGGGLPPRFPGFHLMLPISSQTPSAKPVT